MTKSILDKHIDFYQASKENAQQQLHRCHPDNESYFQTLIEGHEGIINDLFKLKSMYQKGL